MLTRPTRTLRALALLAFVPAPVVAQADALPPLRCQGAGPEWSLELRGDTAAFSFPAPTRMDIPHRARAEGRDWPRALTLIGPRDSAIVLLHDLPCVDGDGFDVQVLTQRGQTPILLTGCCRAETP